MAVLILSGWFFSVRSFRSHIWEASPKTAPTVEWWQGIIFSFSCSGIDLWYLLISDFCFIKTEEASLEGLFLFWKVVVFVKCYQWTMFHPYSSQSPLLFCGMGFFSIFLRFSDVWMNVQRDSCFAYIANFQALQLRARHVAMLVCNSCLKRSSCGAVRGGKCFSVQESSKNQL